MRGSIDGCDDLDVAGLAALPPFGAERYRADDVERIVSTASDADLNAHPEAVMHLAIAAQPGERRDIRERAITRLVGIVGRRPDLTDLRDRLAAEQVHDAIGRFDLDTAETAARALLDDPSGVVAPVARARAAEGLGRVLAWRGSDEEGQAGAQILLGAAAAYEHLGLHEWQGCALVWVAKAVFYDRGDITRARELMEAGMARLDPSRLRFSLYGQFLGDVLVDIGRLDEAERMFDRCAAVASAYGDAKCAAFVGWSRARLETFRRNPAGVRRAIAQVEQSVGTWQAGPAGSTFLAEAAEMLDQVGDVALGRDHLERARAAEPDNECVLQAEAIMLARRGNPADALAALRSLPRQPRLEARLRWRHALYEAWATLRARRDGAAALAAEALALAEAGGGVQTVTGSDADLVEALAPLAVQAGSLLGLQVLTGDRGVILRLLGDVHLQRGAERIELPGGAPGTVLRLLALHPGGCNVETLIDTLWPEASIDVGRRQLRGVLLRVRRHCGDVVVRDGDMVRLDRVWVDVGAFRRAADRALASSGPDAASLATAALALWGGEPFPGDVYADWARDVRSQLRRRHLALLDLLARDATARGSVDEAVEIVLEAIDSDPGDEARYLQLARLELARGRPTGALDAVRSARAAAAALGLRVGEEVAQLEAQIGAL